MNKGEAMQVFMVIGKEQENWGGELVWCLGVFADKTQAQALIDKAPKKFERHDIEWEIEEWTLGQVEESLTGRGRWIGGCFE